MIQSVDMQVSAAERCRIADSGYHIYQAGKQAAHSVHLGHLSQSGVLTSKIIQPQQPADTPAPRSCFFHDKPCGLRVGTDFSDHFLQYVLHCYDAGGATKFVQNDGKPPLLTLQALEQLQQIHRLGHERRKLDRVSQIHLRV